MSPGSVGPAVSLAQGLLPLRDRFQYLSDSTGAAPRHMLPKAVTYRDMPDKIGFELAPNPATTHVWVKLHQAASGRIRILDVSGKVVRSKQLEKDRQYVWLPIADLAAGIYLVSLHKEDGTGSTKKLVISK